MLKYYPLDKQYLFELARFVVEENYNHHCGSNQLFNKEVDEVYLEELKLDNSKIVKSGLKKIIISLDGVTQETYETYRVGGNLNKTLQAIEYINAEKKAQNSRFPAIELQMIIFRHNEHEIEAFKKIARKMKVQKITIKTAQIYNYTEKTELIPTIKKYSRYKTINGNWELKKKLHNRCLRMWQSAVITTDGELLPCCFDKNADFSYGNLNKYSVKELWNNDKALSFRKRILSNRKSIDMCQNCSE